MIGSQRKVISGVKELEKEGTSRWQAFEASTRPWPGDRARVTPEEIAVAVVAEMIAVRRQRGISKWRDLSKSIFANAAPESVAQ